MFLHDVYANDSRFKTLHFHEGMNILLAERASNASDNDSRNGAGKTSLIHILRYLLGGTLRKGNPLLSDELSKFTPAAHIELAQGCVSVERPLRPKSNAKVKVDGILMDSDEWKTLLGRVYGLNGNEVRPTVGQLTAQTVRTQFDDCLKTYDAERDWEIGARIGYLLGLSPSVLCLAGDITKLRSNKSTLKQAIRDEVLPGVSLKEAEIRSELVAAQRKRDALASDLSTFTVDEQYTDHQKKADALSQEIRSLNDESLSLRQRQRDLTIAMQDEDDANPASSEEIMRRLRSMYDEVGVVIPDASLRRYGDVRSFHESVIRNRKLFLESELNQVERRLRDNREQERQLDVERAEIMRLLDSSMALETFREMQRELNEFDVQVEQLEQRLKLAASFADIDLTIKEKTTDARIALRLQMEEHRQQIDEAISLFSKIGHEIYRDREMSLIIRDTEKGVFKVEPRISGDSSAGIAQVETFILDMVCMVIAMSQGRAPRLLVHDSRLFDSMDDRQVTSCLNIGARLADEHGFQYIVTMNSDRFSQAEQSGFDRRAYVLDPVLTDSDENGGLFGFRFN